MALRPRTDHTPALMRAATLLDAARKTHKAAEEAVRHAAFVRNDAEQEFDRRELEARGAVWGETLVMMTPDAYKPGEPGLPCLLVDVGRRDRDRRTVVLAACDDQGRPQEDGVFTAWLDQVDLEAEVRLEVMDNASPSL